MPIIAKKGWATPKSLARACNLVRHTGPLPWAIRGRHYLNWGRTDIVDEPFILNRPTAIRKSANKLTAFGILKEANVPTPKWTTDPAEAQKWVWEDKTVYGRGLLSSFGGRGIRLWGTKFPPPLGIEDFQGIRLFTRFWKCDYEARYHVWRGEVIDVQRKMRIAPERFERLPEPLRKLSFWVRNHANGWVFGRSDVVRHAEAARISCEAVRCLGLDFGAVDVRVRGDKAVVLEVNSAPGLTGTTLVAYTTKIREYLRGN